MALLLFGGGHPAMFGAGDVRGQVALGVAGHDPGSLAAAAGSAHPLLPDPYAAQRSNGHVAQTQPPPPPAKRTALIVGINNARGGRPLPGSLTDAQNLRDALIGYGFKEDNVVMLLEREATGDAIRAGLDSLAARTPRDGIAVFAIATHTRRYRGQNELLTADGGRIGAGELADRLGRVRGRMWVALPTCYAAGYALPGIVGSGRVATFASPQDQPTYQLGTAGSYLFINMVRKAMLEGRAPGSVEDAFRFAEETLREQAPGRVPSMSDGVTGDLVLGRPPPPRAPADRAEQEDDPGTRDRMPEVQTEQPPPPQPSAPPSGGSGSSGKAVKAGVCGSVRFNCGRA